jgi:hypothetical protein
LESCPHTSDGHLNDSRSLGRMLSRRVSITDPTATLADLLAGLNRPVRAIDIRKPSLDDLYRALAVRDAA